MTVATSADTMVTFEHPVNEQIRLYLRIEYLFQAFEHHMIHAGKEALTSLLRITSVLNRPDLKSKLVQLLMLHTNNLRQLSDSPGIDNNRLSSILSQLEAQTKHLHAFKGKLGEHLRQNEFLNQIRLHLTNPAGPCENALPAFHLWLKKLQHERAQDLQQWSQPLNELHNAIKLLLRLIRQSTPPQKVISDKGFYQQTQDTHAPCALIRVSLPSNLELFPEFSANKHRIILRFLTADIYGGGKPAQTDDDIGFLLACCRI